MKQLLPKVLLPLALIGGTSVAYAAPLTFVKNGQPNATIIVQANAPAHIKQAGADLQRYIEKISGVQLPIKTDGKDVSGITLNVGKTDSTIESDLPTANLNPETYAITQRGDDVYFEGNYPSPTAFAVYSFLQDQLGVRWFAPGSDWEYVPQLQDKSTFTVDVKNIVSVPGTSPRIWSGHYWTADWNTWMLRNKVTRGESKDEFIPHRNFQNNMYHIFPPSKYAKTHPEYYPLENGKRYIPKDDNDRYWWPCIGNPDVQRITAEYIHQWFLDHPDQDSFSLGMDDIAHNCSDPLCRAMDAHPDDYEKGHLSNRFYTFINIIAKKIQKTDPGKFIGVLVYRNTLELPEKVPHVEDNVFGFLADGGVAQWYQPGKKEEWMNTAREWSKRMKHLSRYDYYGMGTFAPRVITHSMDEAMKFDKSLHFEGMYVEVYTFLPQTAPMIWSFAQLQWNPQKNVDALLDDFYTKMFGDAAPTMQKYFDLMEKSWFTPRPNHDGWVNYDIVRQATSISPEALDEGLQLLQQATAQAKTPLEKKRIGIVQGGLQYAGYAIREYTLAQKLADLNLANIADAQAGVEAAKKLGAIMKERQEYWPAAMQRKDLLGANLRGLYGKKSGSGKPLLQTDTSPLETPAIPGLVHLMDWYRTNQPQNAAQIATQLQDAFPKDSVFDAVFAWNWVQQSNAKSLVRNGDFESTAKSTAPAAQEDWDTKGAPTNWSSWSRLNQGEFKRAAGRDDKGNSWQLATPVYGDKAALVQNVPVQAGQKYLGVAWLKLSNPENPGRVGFTLRYRITGGWYTGKNYQVTIRPEKTAGWQRLMIPIIVPPTVTAVAITLEVEGPAVAFDDVALYQIQ